MRDRISSAAAAWPATGAAQKVPAQNYHLTLEFIGEATPAQLVELLEIGVRLRAVCCTIQFDAYEYWPHSQVMVAAACETPASLTLMSMRLRQDIALHPATTTLLYPHRPLRPHVTLARKVVQAPVQQAMSAFCWTARSFSLVRSDTRGARALYTVVDTWPLLDEMPNP